MFNRAGFNQVPFNGAFGVVAVVVLRLLTRLCSALKERDELIGAARPRVALVEEDFGRNELAPRLLVRSVLRSNVGIKNDLVTGVSRKALNVRVTGQNLMGSVKLKSSLNTRFGKAVGSANKKSPELRPRINSPIDILDGIDKELGE